MLLVTAAVSASALADPDSVALHCLGRAESSAVSEHSDSVMEEMSPTDDPAGVSRPDSEDALESETTGSVSAR